MPGKNENNKTRHTNTKTQQSAIVGLYPYLVVDRNSGDMIDEKDWTESIRHLVKYVVVKSEEVVNAKEDEFIRAFESPDCPSQTTGIAHTFKLSPNVGDLSDNLLAKSRIKELIEHKSVSEFRAYWENDNPLKQRLTFSPKINLGAVNNQMASIEVDKERCLMVLSWKCWDKNMDLFFLIPCTLHAMKTCKKYRSPQCDWMIMKKSYSIFL